MSGGYVSKAQKRALELTSGSSITLGNTNVKALSQSPSAILNASLSSTNQMSGRYNLNSATSSSTSNTATKGGLNQSSLSSLGRAGVKTSTVTTNLTSPRSYPDTTDTDLQTMLAYFQKLNEQLSGPGGSISNPRLLAQLALSVNTNNAG